MKKSVNSQSKQLYLQATIVSLIDKVVQHFNFQQMHTTLKKRRVIRTFLKQVKLLQHVSVYKKTIMREPQSVLS